MLNLPLFTPLHLKIPSVLDQEEEPVINNIDDQYRVISEAESLVIEEMRLGTLTSDPAAPSPTEQTLKAFTVTDYAFSIEVESPLLVMPVGPLTTLEALSIDGDAVDLTTLIVQPWSVRTRDGSSFTCGSDATLTATVGWSDPASVPYRIRSATQFAVLDLVGIHAPTSLVRSQEIDGDVETFFDPRRARLHQHIAPLVSAWSRPVIF